MYPQEVLQRGHIHTVVSSCSIAMFSRLHVSPRDLHLGHMQTYLLSCSIAMFSRLHVSPRDLQRGHKQAIALSCSDFPSLCVPKRFFNRDTYSCDTNKSPRQEPDHNDLVADFGNEQSGFRKGHSTMDHVFALHCLIDVYLQRKRKLFCAFIDY